MKKPAFIFSLLVVAIIALSIVHVVVSNMLSTTGIELENLQTDIAKYKKENTLLEEKVLQASSLDHIASAAARMGFVNEKATLVIESPLPIAQR